MNSNEFMKKLEYLLSDISEEDKADALAFYRDYLEEAGENADKAIEEFGSPERIAAIIRSELAGNLKEGGAFTDYGYEDERFRDPNYQVAQRLNLPEEKEGGWQRSPEGTSNTQNTGNQKSSPRTSGLLKFVLWVILIIVAAPALLGAGGIAFGLAAGFLGILVGVIAFLGTLTLALLLGGISLCGVGILAMLKLTSSGLLMLGAGIVIIGLGILSLMVSILFYGRFLPWLIRGIVDGISRLVHGRRKAR